MILLPFCLLPMTLQLQVDDSTGSTLVSSILHRQLMTWTTGDRMVHAPMPSSPRASSTVRQKNVLTRNADSPLPLHPSSIQGCRVT